MTKRTLVNNIANENNTKRVNYVILSEAEESIKNYPYEENNLLSFFKQIHFAFFYLMLENYSICDTI